MSPVITLSMVLIIAERRWYSRKDQIHGKGDYERS